MTTINTWTTEQAVIVQKDYDYDLKVLDVYGGLNKDCFLGTILPSSVETMHTMVKDLDEGACPLADSWEDGLGNICNKQGFNNLYDYES